MAEEKRFRKIKKENISFGESAIVLQDTQTGVNYLFVQTGYAGGLDMKRSLLALEKE